MERLARSGRAHFDRTATAGIDFTSSGEGSSDTKASRMGWPPMLCEAEAKRSGTI